MPSLSPLWVSRSARLNRGLGNSCDHGLTLLRHSGLARMAPSKFRLVTRSDFDGLVCGMLLRELNMIDEIKFVHPKDMQDGIVPITDRDIITNLPYVAGCHL